MATCLLLCPLILTACTGTYPAYPQVPLPLNENVPAAPASNIEQSWRPGYFDWNGASYDWHPGKWVPLAGHSTQWQDGYWRQTGTKTYEWVSPGWS